MKRLILSILISYSLVLRNDCIAATGETTNSKRELEHLLTLHSEIISGDDIQGTLAKVGPGLIDLTSKFISDPKNKDVLNSSTGIELQKHQQLLGNYLAVKNQLENCIAEKENINNLNKRILSASLQEFLNSSFSPCQVQYTPFQNLLQFEKEITKVANANKRNSFQVDLSSQILKNTARSLLGFKYKFEPEFMKNGTLSQKEIDQIFKEICHPGESNDCRKLPERFKEDVAIELRGYSDKLLSSEKKFNAKSATEDLNKSIIKLNTTLEKVKFTKEEHFFSDTALLNNKESKKEFDNYMNTYFQEVSKGAGPLLLTSRMKKVAGEIKTSVSEDTEKNKKTQQFQFIPYKPVTQKDVEKSIVEIKEKIMDQAEEITSKLNRGKRRFETNVSDLADLNRINPFASGQLLMHHPEYAPLVCDSIKKIEDDKQSDEKFRSNLHLGLLVIGGALVLTGVGTLAGAYILTGSLTAGVAAGTVGGSIMAYSSLAGGALELGSVTYFGKKSYEHYQEVSKIEASYITENNDRVSFEERKREYEQYKSDRLIALVALGSASFGAIKAGYFFTLKSVGASTVKNEIVNTSQILEVIKKPTVASKIKDTITLLGKGPWDKMNRALQNFAVGSEKARLRFLAYLQDSSITPEKLKAIIEANQKISN